MSHEPPAAPQAHTRRRKTSLVAPLSATEPKAWHNPRTSSSDTGHNSPTLGFYEDEISALPTRLETTSGTPHTPHDMSLDCSPALRSNGGWSSPGLDGHGAGRGSAPSSPRRAPTLDDHNEATWKSAKGRAFNTKGFSPLSTSSRFMPRKMFRQLSISLPRFNRASSKDYSAKEKLGCGRVPRSWKERVINLGLVLWRIVWKLRAGVTLLLAITLVMTLFYKTPAHHIWQRTSWLGGGNKFVVIVAANQGGGVMEWKGAREWAIERDSVKNKKKYAARHGYDLEIVDMAIKKRYAHEWRESWEKVDTIRRCLTKYPKAEWFWWLDLNTFIMEPSYSLQHHLFNNIASNTYRDINVYNPLNITHPPDVPYLDTVSASPIGDGLASSIDMVVPQDCSGFNLGSFFMRRSAWTDRLLDVWWDPVQYEQRHMQWEHKEQDAFEYLYTSQPWVRTHTAFVPQRKVCSFPKGACGEGNTTIHYSERDRDFVVNMAGCEWGRDCWGEMYNFRELSNRLNRSWWEKLKDGAFKDVWRRLRGFKTAEKKTKTTTTTTTNKKNEKTGEQEKKDEEGDALKKEGKPKG